MPILGLILAALPVSAQSPNNSAIAVVVLDQQGGVVPAATVTVTNTATGATRTADTGDDGGAAFAALPLTGAYAVTIEKPGFAGEERRDITLRAGESATLRVTLVPAGATSEVRVYGTVQGVRSDAQIGRRLDGETLDQTPILGRKITTVPLFNSAFRQGKGTGDLFVNATYFITASGSRRTTTFMLDGASNDEGWAARPCRPPCRSAPCRR